MVWENQILLIPGPTPVPPRVLRAMSAPAVNHRGVEFKALIQEVTEGIKKIYSTTNDLLILTSSGTGGMEAAVANFLAPGDKALVVSIGSFGDRFKKICKAYNVQVEALDFEWGTAADPAQVAARLKADTKKEIKAVLVQHNETSTGVLNDLKAISKAKGDHPALLIVDAVSGLMAADLKTDAWGLDVVVSGSQKAFMIPPGLAMVSVSKRAWEAAEKNPNSRFYFDLKQAKEFLKIGETPWTPAESVYFGLRESLKMIAEEGLEECFARHRRHRDMVRSGVRALGLEPLAADAVASPAVTAIKVPEGIEPGQITKPMLQKYNVVLAKGQGKLENAIFRMGHLGYVGPLDLLAGLAALEMVLEEIGLKVDKGAGVRAAQQVLSGGAK